MQQSFAEELEKCPAEQKLRITETLSTANLVNHWFWERDLSPTPADVIAMTNIIMAAKDADSRERDHAD